MRVNGVCRADGIDGDSCECHGCREIAASAESASFHCPPVTRCNWVTTLQKVRPNTTKDDRCADVLVFGKELCAFATITSGCKVTCDAVLFIDESHFPIDASVVPEAPICGTVSGPRSK